MDTTTLLGRGAAAGLLCRPPSKRNHLSLALTSRSANITVASLNHPSSSLHSLSMRGGCADFSSSQSRSLFTTRRRSFLPRVVASMEAPEQSYIMVKPDGVQRGLVGEIISRFEKKGFTLKGLKLFQCPKDLAEEHYKDLIGKPFFPTLIEYITSGPVVCMAWEGAGVVASARKLIGATNPLQAEPGTIRGDLAVQTGRNVVHGSDSPENGEREIALWFKEGELCEWEPAQSRWLRG